MFKKNVFLLLFLLSFLFINGQTINFIRSIEDFSQVKVTNMEKTTDDGLVIAVDFPGHRHMGKYYGLYKYDNFGQNKWKFNFFGNRIDFLFLDFTLDEFDNIYGLVYIDEFQESSIQGKTIYPGLNLMKINSQGDVIWNKKIGSNVESENACIKYKNGNLYIIGTYIDSLNLDDRFFFTSQDYYQCYMWMYFSGTDYFIAKYDTAGAIINAVSLGEDYPDNLITMEIDDDENIYFSGISDNFPCVSSYFHITKLNSNLCTQWVNSLSHGTDSPYYIPMNIHSSKNGNLYVWNNAVDNISNGSWVTDNKSPYLMEIEKNNGKILRTRAIEASSVETSYIAIKKHYTNGFMADFNNDLIIHTAFNDSLVLNGETLYSKERYSTLVLLKINLTDLSVTLIGKMEGSSDNYFLDMPGKIIVNEPYIYFTGEFGEKPLDVFGSKIFSKGGNIFDTNVFFCKADMTSYINNSSNLNYTYYIDEELILYPNPASDILYIKTEDETLINIEVFTIDGRTVLLALQNTNTLDVSKLLKGSYIIKIKTEKGYKLGKFIKRD